MFEARIDTICPIQITKNAAIPAGCVFFGIEYPLYNYKVRIKKYYQIRSMLGYFRIINPYRRIISLETF
jgi:hypothetical protein